MECTFYVAVCMAIVNAYCYTPFFPLTPEIFLHIMIIHVDLEKWHQQGGTVEPLTEMQKPSYSGHLCKVPVQ